MRHDHEDQVVRVGCAFMMLALVVAFLASLPLFDQLLNDADALHRDVEERGHR